jgi:hypothetical protein
VPHARPKSSLTCPRAAESRGEAHPAESACAGILLQVEEWGRLIRLAEDSVQARLHLHSPPSAQLEAGTRTLPALLLSWARVEQGRRTGRACCCSASSERSQALMQPDPLQTAPSLQPPLQPLRGGAQAIATLQTSTGVRLWMI